MQVGTQIRKPSLAKSPPRAQPAQPHGIEHTSTRGVQSRFAHDFSQIALYSPTPRVTPAKLAINQPGDPYEQEADHMAGRVMRHSGPAYQLAGTDPVNPALPSPKSHLQRQIRPGQSLPQSAAPPIIHQVLRTPGRPLDAATRSWMEPRFGMDLGHVRLHTDAHAAESAQAIRANAYTVDNHIAFAEGHFAPSQEAGRRLLAHELTHVAQQQATRPLIMRQPSGQTKPTNGPDDGLTAKDKEDANKLQPYRIDGTPFTIIPLELPRDARDVIHVYGYSLPYRAVRITNKDEDSPLPKVPEHLKDAPGLVQPKPGAAGRLIGLVTGGPDKVLDDLPKEVDLERAPPGQPPGTVPRFAITLRSGEGRVDVLDRVILTLYPDLVPGTPLHGKLSEDNLQRHSVKDPSLVIGKDVSATATYSRRDPFPSHGIDPTEVSIEARSKLFSAYHAREKRDLLDFGTLFSVRASALGGAAGAKAEVQAFVELKRINAALAPLGVDQKEARVIVHEIIGVLEAKFRQISQSSAVDTLITATEAVGVDGSLRKSLNQIIRQHIAPGTSDTVIDHAVNEVFEELTNPGLTVNAPIHIAMFPGYAHFRAETTRHTRKPFEGSGIGTPFPATLATAGPTIIPAGAISGTATPGLGAGFAHDFQNIALSASIATRPYLDTSLGLAGVATARMGFRIGGVDVIIQGGFRGQVPISGGAAAANTSFSSNYENLQTLRQNAVRDRAGNVDKDERGEFSPDLHPDEVLSDPHLNEFFGTITFKKKF